MRTLVAVLSSAALMAFAACKKTSNEPPAAAVPTAQPAVAAGSAVAGALTDPQIAAIVVAANQVDVDAGDQAIKKTKNAQVKAFAQVMVNDHTAVNKAAGELVTKLKVTPEESDASRTLTSGGAEMRAKLDKLDGDAFDRAYIDNEVAYHKAVISALDSKLIPAATNPELKSTLVGVRPAFDTHLQHAVQIQATLAGPNTADQAPVKK